jgi:hypothetical protein
MAEQHDVPKAKAIDPVDNEYLGEVKLGFYRNRKTNKMIMSIGPNPANREDKAAMATMALYTAAIRESIGVINQNIEQAQLIEKLRGMQNDKPTTVPEGNKEG